MVGVKFVAEVVLKEVIGGLTGVVVEKFLRPKPRRREYNIHYHTEVMPWETNTNQQETNNNQERKEAEDDRTNMSPFEIEFGDALTLYNKRYNLFRYHPNTACYDNRDNLFALGATLKDLEPHAGSQLRNLLELIKIIDKALCGEHGDIADTARQLYIMLSGDDTA